MRTFLLNLLIIFISFSFVLDAQAKRFGGGKSFGMSRQASSFSRPTSMPHAAPSFQQSAKPASTASKWLGPLAGFAAGGLLASLFMGHGLGGGMLSWLLIAVVAFFAWQFIRNRFQSPVTAPRQQAQNDYQAYQAQQPAQNNFQTGQQPSTVAVNDYSPTQSLPADFNEAEFLRSAKATFIRLQAAFDNKNLTDIREFTAPEIFAEIQLQIQERGSEPNHTEVISIDAELLDVTTSGQTIATVLFSGQVREEQGAEPVAIKEMWHFNKDLFRKIWIVSGIQQA